MSISIYIYLSIYLSIYLYIYIYIYIYIVKRTLVEMHLTHSAERKANSLPPRSISQVAAGMSEKGGLEWRAFFLALGVHNVGHQVSTYA